MKKLLAVVLLCAGASAAADWTYWIEPRAGGDPELAEWALQAWERASEGQLHLVRTSRKEDAMLRVLWVTGQNGLYGEARPIEVKGRRGAELYVRPEMDGLGAEIESAAAKDRLLRDAIVYLTCLHESGHGLGLPHTGAFADIMYTFGAGGDIVEYFGRYRRALGKRGDIKTNSGMSSSDAERLKQLLTSAR